MFLSELEPRCAATRRQTRGWWEVLNRITAWADGRYAVSDYVSRGDLPLSLAVSFMQTSISVYRLLIGDHILRLQP